MDKPLSKGQIKYLEEYEKYKHIQIDVGEYHIKNNIAIVYVVTSITENSVMVTNKNSGFAQEKTIHWARKNLVKAS
jgi:hypothetical protein